MSSIFLEGLDPEEIEADTKFHEPEYVSTGDDGEFAQKKDTIPGTVPASKPCDCTENVLGEFSSIFYESDDTEANKKQKEVEKEVEKATKDTSASKNEGSGSKCESTFLDSIKLI